MRLRKGNGRGASFKRRLFARHSNPVSAWSRWATIPLVLVPFWRRSKGAAVAVSAWMLVNPVLFRPPKTERAWSTRAMLGEERWSSRPRLDRATILNTVSTVMMLTAIVGSWKKSWLVAAPATAVQMTLTLGFWKIMADDFYVESQS